RPDQRADYDALLQDLLKQGRLPESVVHMWTLAPEKEAPEIEAALKEGYYSLLALTQALGDQDLEHCSITIVSNHTQEVLGSEHLCPEKATLAGPCRVIAQEYTSVSCRLLDIELPAVGSDQEEPLLAALLNELTVETSDALVALRGKQRWIQSFEPVPLLKQSSQPRLRHRGVYL